MTTWTFEPPFPDRYYSSRSKKLFIAAEPNGDNDRLGGRDMGDWIRNVPKTGTKFYRYLVSIAATFAGIDVDLKGKFDPYAFLGDWRFIDLVKEEAGSVVTGDFKKRVRNNLDDTLNIITGDIPSVIVLLGSHAQESFEKIVVPSLSDLHIDRLGLPHPSSRIGGYVNRGIIGDPNLMLRRTPAQMMTYGYRTGWVRFNK